jgi:excisionase family DNA binding protein
MDDFYTINQAAFTLKVHPLTVRRYIKEGKLKAYKVGGNVRVSISDLRNFVEGFTPNPKLRHLSIEQKKPFTINDPLFRMKARGLSMNKATLE